MQFFADTVVKDCEKHHINSIANRKPRKKKVRGADDQVAKLQYMKQDTKYKIVSVEPATIIGASQLWVFNTNTRDLTVFNTMRRDGFEIKGTTLHGWDPDTSETKKLRKPEEVIQTVLTGGSRTLKKLMTSLTTKSTPTNGRINKHCILLKVTK